MAETANSRKVIDLPIDDVLPNRYQPRIKFDDTAIFELSESIKAHGVFQPIIVRPIGDKYEIIAGERRYKASVLANKETIPAIIMNLNDKDSIEIALIENVQRSNLTPIEEAISYKKILDMGYIKQEDLAHKLGKTQSTIANKIRLLNLDEDVQEALLEGKISERHARSLLRLKNIDNQKIMLKRIINERLTVRVTDEEIEKMMNNDINGGSPMIEQQNSTIIPTEQPAQMSPVVEDIPSQNNNVFMDVKPVNSVFGFNSNEIINTNPNASANTSTVIASTPASETPSIEATKMDIEKIENEASPVFEEKPLAKMDELLKSATPVMPTNNASMQENEEQEDPASVLQPGKFFNFPESSEPAPTPLETPSNEEKGFAFNNFAQPDSNQQQEYVQPEQNQSMFNSVTPATPEVSPIPVVPTVEPTMPFESSVSQEVQPNIPTTSIMPEVNASVEPTPIQPAQNFDSLFATQSSDKMDTEEVVIPSTMPSFLETNDNTIPAAMPALEPTIPMNSNFAVPSQQPATPEVPAPRNIMSAVSVIREAVQKLEQLGYTVDVDEIDLEAMYQLIIKIDKD
ncbi:MAG: ParB/RepB/Spo0J family partition protein [Bacilli bacterium]|nr:ParB/RepB/Spo0J family partition protein [Bacilli bacterium]